MGLDLRGFKIAVIGGDQRDIYLMQELVKMGASVSAIGFSPCHELNQVQLVDRLEIAIHNVQVLILPMGGTDTEGNIKCLDQDITLRLSPEIAAAIHEGVLLIIGFARDFVKEWALKYKWNMIEIANMETVAIMNSIPSAEGALQWAMEKLPITIHGSNSYVLGFGRMGKTLARMLHGIGARTTVVARKRSALFRAFEMGYSYLHISQLSQRISEADLIFNTIPAMILDEKLLSYLNKDTLIIDIASSPGGTDFTAAKRMGIQAILTPSLPGLVAPKTGGKILAQVIPQLILKEVPHEYLRE
ncbi:MAG: dipicolinate synthase subunit DpsA [Syntrophaceticus sp.]|nr:dipicolinate synthase subunit DpsA [Syntrophaceticus sp.]MDD3313921.1 dipicolinate synthase subunit DpsA [Syntrophaceticus sp.]MDD4358999.1 dipicolinate synthase subunit DpsA [Syntrophaceticus sp.]MDD4782226.1 dipicolinate synthase subunit DpsA [Syntrophaceticus sp.]